MGIAMWCDDPFCKFHGFQWENMEPYELKDLQDLEASWNIYGSWVHVPWSVKLVCLTLPQVPSMVGENTMTIRNHIPRKVGMIIAAKDMDLWICSCFFLSINQWFSIHTHHGLCLLPSPDTSLEVLRLRADSRGGDSAKGTGNQSWQWKIIHSFHRWFPMKTSIYMGFPIGVFDYGMVFPTKVNGINSLPRIMNIWWPAVNPAFTFLRIWVEGQHYHWQF